MRDPPDRPVVAGLARALLDVARVDDQPVGEAQHLAGEREVLRPRLPERRDAVVEHAVREQASGEPVVALHRVEVAGGVAPREREPGDEVMEDELVQADDARPAPERLDDPAVRLRVVADVVERDVAPTGARRNRPGRATSTSTRRRSAGRSSAL